MVFREVDGLEPWWTRTMQAINDNRVNDAIWWAAWVEPEELQLASPVQPIGSTVWHLLAARMLTPSVGRTRLLEILAEKVADPYRASCSSHGFGHLRHRLPPLFPAPRRPLSGIMFAAWLRSPQIPSSTLVSCAPPLDILPCVPTQAALPTTLAFCVVPDAPSRAMPVSDPSFSVPYCRSFLAIFRRSHSRCGLRTMKAAEN